MDSWNADLILSVLPFLNVIDLNRLSRASRRSYYLVLKYREVRGPELVAATSHIPGVKTRQRLAAHVLDDALSRLQSAPNLALGFRTHGVGGSASLDAALQTRLPGGATALIAVADSIQSSVDGHVECQSHSSLLLASLPRADVRGFCFDSAGQGDGGQPPAPRWEAWVDGLRQGEAGDGAVPRWKAFLVYACGAGPEEALPFVHRLQAAFPAAAITGGVCTHGSVTLPASEIVARLRGGRGAPLDVVLSEMSSVRLVDLARRLGGPPHPQGRPKRDLVQSVQKLLETRTHGLHMVEDGIFGVALGGDVPVRSVVSLGVRSLTRSSSGQQAPSGRPATHLKVDHVDFYRPGDDNYLFRFPDARETPPYHLVRSVKDRTSGQTLTLLQMLRAYGDPDLIGVQRPGEDGFELHTMQTASYDLNAFLLFAEGLGSDQSLQDADIDFFDLDGRLCLVDLESKLVSLQATLQSAGERIMGAVMFSCNGRGPMPGMLINERMADAQRFATRFPAVPLLGYYAFGEIGPLALAGRQSVFQTGNATMQGYTVVFAVFIAPTVDLAGLSLDDSAENVNALVRERLSSRT